MTRKKHEQEPNAHRRQWGVVVLSVVLIGISNYSLANGQDEDTGGSPSQWILVTPSQLKDIAAPLIRQRRGQGWQVEVVTHEIADPANKSAEALQSKLAQLCTEFDGTSCILLLGSWKTQGKQTVVSSLKGTQGRMAGMTTDYGFGNPKKDGGVTVAVGRLPARTPAQAELMIAKVLAFESMQPTHNRVSLFVGHPGGRNDFEKTFAGNIVKSAVESRLKRLHSRWDVTCVMDIDGSKLSVNPKDFSTEVKRLLKWGQHFAVYSGHSSAAGLNSRAGRVVSRRVFQDLRTDGPSGVFLSCGCFSCQISGFDGEGHGIVAIRNRFGPASVIGALGESYAAHGQLALDGALRCLMLEEPPKFLGGYWLAIQNGIARGKITPGEFMLYDMADGSGGRVPLEKQRLEHAEMWVLLGDPGMRIPIAVDK